MTKTKPQRTKERVVIEIPRDLKEWLLQHCEQTGHTATWVITKLIEQYREQRS